MRTSTQLFSALCLALLVGCGSVAVEPDAAVDASSADAGIDAAVADAMQPADASPPDADPPDAAPPPVVYDVAFISDFTFAPSISSIGSWAVVIGRGTQSIDMTTAKIVSVTDDHPTANVVVSVNAPTTNGTLLPNQYAGSLSPLATTRIIDSNIVTEPKNSMSFSFSMVFQNNPSTTTNVNVIATLDIEGTQIAIPIIVRFVVGGSTAFNQASRISTN